MKQRNSVIRRDLCRTVSRLQSAVLMLAVPLALSGARTASAATRALVVTQVSQPGVVLRVPRDGRLSGNAFSVRVTGYRFAYQVGTGSSTEEARRGRPSWCSA